MPYADFRGRVVVLESAAWYRVSTLRKAVTALRAVNFNIQAQRDQALQRLAGLPVEAPFGENERFADGMFVCEDLGDWARKLQQLRTALTFKDMSKDGKVAAGQHRSSDSSDAVQSFHNSLTAIAEQLVRLDGVYDRETFEEDFGLIWAE